MMGPAPGHVEPLEGVVGLGSAVALWFEPLTSNRSQPPSNASTSAIQTTNELKQRTHRQVNNWQTNKQQYQRHPVEMRWLCTDACSSAHPVWWCVQFVDMGVFPLHVSFAARAKACVWSHIRCVTPRPRRGYDITSSMVIAVQLVYAVGWNKTNELPWHAPVWMVHDCLACLAYRCLWTNTFLEGNNTLNKKLAEHHIRDWIGVSAVGLQGESFHERNVLSQTPVCHTACVVRADVLPWGSAWDNRNAWKQLGKAPGKVWQKGILYYPTRYYYYYELLRVNITIIISIIITTTITINSNIVIWMSISGINTNVTNAIIITHIMNVIIITSRLP